MPRPIDDRREQNLEHNLEKNLQEGNVEEGKGEKKQNEHHTFQGITATVDKNHLILLEGLWRDEKDLSKREQCFQRFWQAKQALEASSNPTADAAAN